MYVPSDMPPMVINGVLHAFKHGGNCLINHTLRNVIPLVSEGHPELSHIAETRLAFPDTIPGDCESRRLP